MAKLGNWDSSRVWSNTTTGALIPEWHSIYPSGMSTYTPDGYYSFIITANDTTQPEDRLKQLTLPASPSEPVYLWAIVAQHSLAAGGLFHLSNVTILIVNTRTATLPSWVGMELINEFKFYDECKVHYLKSSFGDEL
ncbi:hypothetical protein BKA64DRAFT_694060 [Cadophora sp. MPI-SDFR-AT-0126]|nr:hypothetical protein BKA64DRAFT_694060 [Leotiomycetes sp. MPI-SDFR-AT-0126]